MDKYEGLPGGYIRAEPDKLLSRLEAELTAWDAQVRAHSMVIAEAGGPTADLVASIALSEKLWSLLWLCRFGETYEEFATHHRA